MSVDPFGTIRARIVDLQGNAVGGQVSNNDWRLIVDNEQLKFQHYDATANSNAGAYITRQSFGTGLTGISVVPLGTYSITGNLQVTDDLTVDADKYGLIVYSTGKYVNIDNALRPTMNDSLPICDLCSTENDIRVFGVISDDRDDNETRTIGYGCFKTNEPKANTNEKRIYFFCMFQYVHIHLIYLNHYIQRNHKFKMK